MTSTRLLTLILPAIIAAGLACSSSNENVGEGSHVLDQSRFEGDADYYAENAARYYDKGDYYRALSQFTKWHEKTPTSFGAIIGRGFSYYHIGRNLAVERRFDDAWSQLLIAERIFNEVWNGTIETSTDPIENRQWRAALGLALTERSMANLDSISIDVLEARAMSDDTRRARNARVEQEKVREHRRVYYDKALDKFERLAAMQNPPPDVWLNLGDLLYAVREDDDGAERAYLKYLDIARRSVADWEEQRRQVPEIHKKEDDRREATAIIDFKLRSATEKTIGVLLQLSRIKYVDREYAASLGYVQDALTLDPKRTSLNLSIAECYHQLNNQKKALDHVDVFIKSTTEMGADVRRAYELRSSILAKSAAQ